MPPPIIPGEPHREPKPEPLGNILFIFLFTTLTLCLLFLLWRRASSLRTVVSHRLKTWTRREGAIRLSTDDGPPAQSFLEDEVDEEVDDDEPLAQRAARLAQSPADDAVNDVAPHPPPKR